MMVLEEDKLVRTFKLRGSALEAAKKYASVLEESRKEYQSAHDEAVTKLRNLQAHHMENLHDAWIDMAAKVLTEPSPEETWQNNNYRLDVTYMKEHDSAYFNIYNVDTSEIKSQETLDVYIPGRTSGGLVH